MMPIELAQARTDKETAWSKYFDLVEQTKDADLINQAYLMCEILEQRTHHMYNAWQALGGTSDIESIALHKTDVIAHETEFWRRLVIYAGEILEVNQRE